MIDSCRLIFTSIFIVFINGFPVNEHSDGNKIGDNINPINNATQIVGFMRKFGYLDASPITSETLYHEDVIIAAIKNMQKYGAINETGVIDSATLKLLTTPRCGVSDISKSANKTSLRTKRFALGSHGWQKRQITYFIANWSPKVGEDEVARGMADAFKLWSKYSGLRFERISDPNADIIVQFGSGYHGDAFPFDGPGRVLAHAFYPYEMTSYGGDIHFDNDENWKENASHLDEGVDFRSVAVHELGHSLGLAHSPIISSIMFPYYKGPQETKDLGYDDIMAMYELYIKSGVGTQELDQDIESDTESESDSDSKMTSTEAATITTTKSISTDLTTEQILSTKPTKQIILTTIPTEDTTQNVDCEPYETKHRFSFQNGCARISSSSPPNLCASPWFDTVAAIRGEIFIFKGKFLWRLTENYEILSGYPIEFRDIFRGIPDYVENIDAAYERKTDGFIILFHGRKFWVFDGTGFIDDSPRSITEFGFNESVKKVDAAMVWSKNGQTYLFSGTQFLRYNEERKQIDDDYPKMIGDKWQGIPNNIDAAVSLENGKTYFFKGNLNWLYNNYWIEPERGYPQRTSNWLGCTN